MLRKSSASYALAAIFKMLIFLRALYNSYLKFFLSSLSVVVPSSSVKMKKLKGQRCWTHMLAYMLQSDVYYY